MTDTPPSSDDDTSRMPVDPPSSGATYPGPPPGGWEQPPARQGRLRRLAGRARGSRVALGAAGIVVAAALVLGGIAIGHEAHGGGERDGRGASAETKGGNDHGEGHGGDRDGGRGSRGVERDAQADDGRRTNGSTGGGSGTRQQVLGTVTAVSSTSITVRTSGGTPSYPLTATTPVTRGGAAASVANLKAGDAVVLQIVVVSVGAAPVVASISAN